MREGGGGAREGWREGGSRHGSNGTCGVFVCQKELIVFRVTSQLQRSK